MFNFLHPTPFGPDAGPELYEHSRFFRVRFSRSRRLLHLIACRVLQGSERAEEAVRNCFFTARRAAPQFVDEGAFRSWLLRVLIDEALRIRYREIFENKQSVDLDVSALVPGMDLRESLGHE